MHCRVSGSADFHWQAIEKQLFLLHIPSLATICNFHYMEIKHNETLSKALRDAWPDLTRSDKKIYRVITGNYPIACLETLAELAARADVSSPSVIRFIRKIGYESYPEFQRSVRKNVASAVCTPACPRTPSASAVQVHLRASWS